MPTVFNHCKQSLQKLCVISLFLAKNQINSHFRKHNSNINQCCPLFKHLWAGRLAWLGRWLYEPKVAGPSPARPTSITFCLFCLLLQGRCRPRLSPQSLLILPHRSQFVCPFVAAGVREAVVDVNIMALREKSEELSNVLN